ncbi:MAG: SsrA-binding protein SmpB [Phycisphaerae bacterium]
MASTRKAPPKFTNRKARYEFEFLEQIEAGIELSGSEVKSLRAGRATLEDAYAVIRGMEAFLRNFDISPYENASTFQHEPKRERRLLLHRRQIKKLIGKVTQRGFTLVPLEAYFNERGIFKVKIALSKGKNVADKRQSIKDRDQKREMDRAIRGR